MTMTDNSELVGDLQEIEEYFDQRADADLPHGAINYIPNDEMRHLQTIRQAIDRITALQARVAGLERGHCDDCGAKVSSYPNGCPGCGAPNCCQSCCDRANAISRAEDAEAELAKRVAVSGLNQYCSPGCPNLLASHARVRELEGALEKAAKDMSAMGFPRNGEKLRAALKGEG